jgi:hypothetical protein
LPLERLPQDAPYFGYQQAVHGDGSVPSEQVINEHRAAKGTEYRLETEGPHPVPELRQRS